MIIKTGFQLGEEVYFWPQEKYCDIWPCLLIGKKEPIKAPINRIIIDSGGTFFYFKLLDTGFKVPIDEVFREKDYKKYMKKLYQEQIKGFKSKIKELDSREN